MSIQQLWDKFKLICPWIVTLVLAGMMWQCSVNGILSAENKASVTALKQANDSIGTLGTKLTTAENTAATAIAKIDTLWRTRTVTLVTADAYKRIADSIAWNFPKDTAYQRVCNQYLTAYISRTAECEQLRETVATDSVAIRLSIDSLTSIRFKLDSANYQVGFLKDKLKVVQKPYECKLILFVPCLSRNTSFAVGILAGGYIGWRLTK